jgi:hypothetical protein
MAAADAAAVSTSPAVKKYDRAFIIGSWVTLMLPE